MKDNHTPCVLCFGEVLWDIFPEGMKPGGAPLNVAYHLNRLGLDSHIISRVGSDVLGDRMLQQIADWGVSASFCQQDIQFPTGTVETEMDDKCDVTYDIVYPVAWDFIGWEARYQQQAVRADALVFGSLIMRHAVSRETLLKLLPAASYRVFDVNLRQPHYTAEKVLAVLPQTDLLKLNEDELAIISRWLEAAEAPELEAVRLLQERFGIAEILVTRGGKGATYYSGGKSRDSAVYKVKVADTVGSGDAFLAAFLSGRFSGKDFGQEQLDFAAGLGAFVASQNGACPPYDQKDLQRFMAQHQQVSGLNG